LRFRLTRVSLNRKTGPIPVATSSSDTCPTTCPLLTGGCYAKNGPLRLVWQGVDKVGVDFAAFLNLIRALPRRQLWRYGQAGDLPPKSEDIVALAEANRGRPVIAYTHRRDVGAIKTFKEVAKKGFHVNLSADSLVEADDLATTGLPVVVTLSSTYERRDGETLRDFRNRIGGKLRLKTPAGNQIAICPATYADTDCARCHACAKPRPGGTIIGFPAHGASKRKIDLRIGGRRSQLQHVVGVEVDVPFPVTVNHVTTGDAAGHG
jgi:hypothetical protein